MGFAENLAILPPADQVVRVELTAPDGKTQTIDNQPGSQGSVRIYAYLAGRYGAIHPAAAREGLALYAEHVADAERHPGKHPNIDRLLRIAATGCKFEVRILKTLAGSSASGSLVR